ncbi:MAG TPA: DUF3048 domain-containing protein [Mycobacteriales bacterium]
MSLPAAVRRVTVAFVAAGVVAACGGRTVTPASPPAPHSSSTPAPSPVPTLLSPLTGLPVAALGPVVAVKIDNVGDVGQTGLDATDVVYAEEVEGGLTRLLALFSSTTPTAAGPVRSARESDLEVLGPYGKVAFAFSGANAGVLREIRRANVVDDSYDTVTGAYSMDRQRPAPYEFLVNVRKLAAQHPGAAATDVGFRFSAAPPAQAGNAAPGPAQHLTVRFPGTTLSATYADGRYAISRNGRPLTTDRQPVTATNILLQTVTVRSSRYVDHNGARTPYSVTVGHGHASVLRGGLRYDGTWSRPSQTAPTTWTASGGGALALVPGRTWVILVPAGAPVATS